MTNDEIIDGIIEHEGREYTNRPTDKGGPTKFGITLRTLRHWRSDPHLSAEDVAAMNEEEARAIYAHEYIEKPGFNLISYELLRTQLIDFGVTSGPDDAVKALQKVLGVAADGNIGPMTLAALRRYGMSRCNNLVLRHRCLHNARLVEKDPSQAVNIEGWTKRAFDFLN